MTELLLGWDAGASRTHIGFTLETSRPDPDRATSLITDGSEGHMLVFAPTGAGKSRGMVIPNLLHWPGPAIVIDVKGELTATTAAFRRDVLGQEVHVLDPWRVTDAPAACLNPLQVFQAVGQEPADQAFMLASMFAPAHARHADPFWTERAETLLAGLLGAAAASEERATLGWVSDQLTCDDTPYALAKLLDGGSLPDFAYRAIASIVTTAEVTRQGILSTAQSLARPLLSGSVQEACARSSFSLDAVQRGDPMTIYLVVPPAKMASQAPILRLWLSVLMSAITARRQRPEYSTLFVLDEVAQLGRLEQVHSLMTLGRGYGCRAMLVFQSYAQLASLYADHLTLAENAGVIATFGHSARSMSVAMADMFGDISAEALFRMRADQIALKRAGHETRLARRLDYLTDALFAERYTPNPMFGQTRQQETVMRG